VGITFEDLSIKIFADGADLRGIREMAAQPFISGFTTNPTLMRKAGVEDYELFARQVLEAVPDRPISFEVFSDDFDEMALQAKKLASWGSNVFVKIPITNTRNESAAPLLGELMLEGIQLNVTALMTLSQVECSARAIGGGPASYISIFAGRIADTGRDPVPLMAEALSITSAHSNIEVIWASPREILNLVQANDIGCDVITMTNDLLAKVSGLGKQLDQFSLETVQMFYRDAQAAGFSL
jgi:transaldolase